MHWKLITAVFLLVSFDLEAQPYESIFGTTSTSWNQLWSNLPGTGTDSIVPMGTVIIDSISHKEVFYYNRGGSNATHRGFIREDTVNGRVWYASVYDTVEWLIMDLSLAVGDSFWLKGGGQWQPGYYMVDSVYFKSARKHIRLDLPLGHGADGEKFTFIEGIGSNAGITFQDPNDFNLSPFLLCAYRDGTKTYTHSDPKLIGLCYYFNDGFSDINDPERNSFVFKIFPNPAFGSLTIKTDATYDEPMFIEIVDPLGRSLVRKELIKKDDVLDISLLAPGIYVVILSFEPNLKLGSMNFVKH